MQVAITEVEQAVIDQENTIVVAPGAGRHLEIYNIVQFSIAVEQGFLSDGTDPILGNATTYLELPNAGDGRPWFPPGMPIPTLTLPSNTPLSFNNESACSIAFIVYYEDVLDAPS